jgi:cytochrome P450
MSVEKYDEHFDPLLPPDDVFDTIRHQLATCPVVHSDVDGGFWVVNRHADLVRILQDQATFASGNRGVRVPHDPPLVERPPMPPIDSNPPIHRKVREAMNPFLSPQALQQYEPMFRQIIGDLIEKFADDGHCDIAHQLGMIFPADLAGRVLFGIEDEAEIEKMRHWVRRLTYDMFREDERILAGLQEDWGQWCQDLIDQRRSEPPRGDLIDALLTCRVEEEGRLLTDPEVVGAIQISTFGGFSTTADATANIVIRLIEDPALEALLREHPELIAAANEEILRLDPPVSGRPRRCTHDTEIGGRIIAKDDRVVVNYAAANRDPDEWERPEDFDLNRKRNKVMTFSAGPHRCIGSNMARMSLRIMVEELLARITDIQFADEGHEKRVSFSTSNWRAVDELKVTFKTLQPAQALV